MAEHYDGLKAWVDYLTSQAEAGILKYSYYGDWAPPLQQGTAGSIGDSAISIDTPGALMSTGFYCYSAHLLSQIANVLGKTVDAKLYAALVNIVAGSYHRSFWDERTGGYGSNNQACNAFSLYMGLVPAGYKTRVLENLVADIEAHDWHLTTGNLCTKYLLEVLSEYGRADVAYRLATQETYPSWGYMLANGATTLWERWEKMTGGGMNSHNHPMLSSVGSWLYKYLAGITIDPAGSGYSAFNVRPCIVGDLAYVKASIMTIRGRIEVVWERQDARLSLKVTVPAGSRARVSIPKADSACIITESEIVVWQDGAPATTGDQVQFVDQDSHYITFATGSGVYTFSRKLI